MGGSLEDALAAHNPPEVQGTMLLPVPLFHVTGSMGWMMRAFQMGMKMAFMRRWSVPDGIKLIVDEKIGVIGG
jgi:acyl-CoA synthetase (AMP-forming)/AMP-acid ligase II